MGDAIVAGEPGNVVLEREAILSFARWLRCTAKGNSVSIGPQDNYDCGGYDVADEQTVA